MTVLAISELNAGERSLLEQRDRTKALEQAHAAGRLGASRIPDEVLFAGGRDPSDTAIHALLTAFEAGQLVRRSESNE